MAAGEQAKIAVLARETSSRFRTTGFSIRYAKPNEHYKKTPRKLSL
jgi:hypothetical protein